MNLRPLVQVNMEDTLPDVLPNVQSFNSLVMFLKTEAKSGRQRRREQPRWKIYMWQNPDDLVSWYLPISDDHFHIEFIRSLGIFR